MSAPDGRLLAIYDGHCTICQRARRIAASLDWRGRLAFADLHDRAAIEALAPGLSKTDSLAALHLRLADGHTLSGFDAVRRLLGELPLLAPLGWALHIPPLAALARATYRQIARHRPCRPAEHAPR